MENLRPSVTKGVRNTAQGEAKTPGAHTYNMVAAEVGSPWAVPLQEPNVGSWVQRHPHLPHVEVPESGGWEASLLRGLHSLALVPLELLPHPYASTPLHPLLSSSVTPSAPHAQLTLPSTSVSWAISGSSASL